MRLHHTWNIKPNAGLIGQLRKGNIILLPKITDQPCISFYVLFNIVDPDLHKDLASLCFCLSKWSLHNIQEFV